MPWGTTGVSREDISLVELNFRLPEERQKFLLKTPFPVMLLLSRDVMQDRLSSRFTDAKRSITALPLKAARPLIQPPGGVPLQILQDFGQGRRGRKCDQQMNMIARSPQ